MVPNDVQQFRGRVVLVVDDDRDTVESLAAIVRDFIGCEALCAYSGHEALRIIDAGAQVDLLLADIVMPRMDGLTLTHLVKQRLPELPVVLTTGLPTAVNSAEGAGAVALIKPYSPDHLKAIFVEQVARQAGRPRSSYSGWESAAG